METLLSIQAQTFLDWECLIIDDGGTDNTIEITASICKQDRRFQFLRRSINYKKGLPGCRNYGLDLAVGEYVVFFDDDDIVHPDNLKTSLQVVEKNKVDFCHYRKMSFEVEKPILEIHPIAIVKSLTKLNIKEVITQEIGLASCTVFWKKQCFETIRFNENLLYAEEWECYSRIIADNFNGIIIDNILYYNRKHQESNTAEFYRNNEVRRASYTKAVLLVVQNLKEEQLLTGFLKQYFVTLSIDFTEYNLFNAILNILELPTFEKLKWQFFYFTFSIRLPIYKIKKALQNSKQ